MKKYFFYLLSAMPICLLLAGMGKLQQKKQPDATPASIITPQPMSVLSKTELSASPLTTTYPGILYIEL